MPTNKSRQRLRVLVVDDEPLARCNLTVLLRDDPDIGEMRECDSGHAAVEVIRETAPDLVFLDVQMPECNGVEVLEMLGTELPPAIVFVTAHDEYALRAFDVGAVDYLLKPFDERRFRLALDRAKDKITRQRQSQAARPERFVVRSLGRIHFVPVADIDWIEAADYYAQLHLASQTYLLRRSLAELEHELVSRGFCRIHRSIIVNLERVRGLQLRDDGEYDVLLSSEVHLRVSRRFRKGLQERMADLGAAGSPRHT
ncbi:MAG: response regulator transcription factor [Gammaproteobacteria bacterium]|nr:response regulator transcription factor [Gammaproteobacteria bacterium]MBV8402798.1 response regulator transcription factor [Gammaproteobacteria bacterium]